MSDEKQAAKENRLKAADRKKYRYEHSEGHGFGQHHFAQDPTTPGSDLTAEMRELDMVDGTEVTYYADDAETGGSIVRWKDGHGNDRLTTVPAEFFDEHFTEV